MSSPKTSGVPRRRVLWLSHLLPWPPKGGVMQRSYHLMRELARYHDVRLVTFRQRAHQTDEHQLREAIGAIAEFAEVAHVSELPQEHLPGGQVTLAARSLLPGPPYSIRWAMTKQFREAVERERKTFSPDIVHYDSLCLAGYRDKTRTEITVLDHHNIESHMMLRRAAQETGLAKRLYFWQEGLRLAAFERKEVPAFTLNLVCSDLDGSRLADTVGAVRTAVVPNGVDLDYFCPPHGPVTPDPDSMIFVGAMFWYPNASAIRYFIREVWPILSNARPTARLTIVGQGPPADVMESARRDPRIRLLGFVDDIRPLVASSMIYVCPIFDGGGTKLKMIDALAMGKAIVAHRVSAEGLGLTHGTDVMLGDTPSQLSELCLKLFDDHGLRTKLERAARARAEQAFGFDAIGASMARLYADLRMAAT